MHVSLEQSIIKLLGYAWSMIDYVKDVVGLVATADDCNWRASMFDGVGYEVAKDLAKP